jgi:hypothetical protein
MPKNDYWNAKGVLYLSNLNHMLDFSSAYIYRFGKFRFMNKEAKKLYINVNQKFLRKISDHPKSTSKDISFEYDIDSKKLIKSKFGSVMFSDLSKTYQALFMESLLAKVGVKGDVIDKINKLIPGFNTQDPKFQNAISSLSGGTGAKNIKKEVNKTIQKELKKIKPKNVNDLLNKIIPKNSKDKNIGKDLLKKFF